MNNSLRKICLSFIGTSFLLTGCSGNLTKVDRATFKNEVARIEALGRKEYRSYIVDGVLIFKNTDITLRIDNKEFYTHKPNSMSAADIFVMAVMQEFEINAYVKYLDQYSESEFSYFIGDYFKIIEYGFLTTWYNDLNLRSFKCDTQDETFNLTFSYKF